MPTLLQYCKHHRRVQNRKRHTDITLRFDDDLKRIRNPRKEYKALLRLIKFGELIKTLNAGKPYLITNRAYLAKRTDALNDPTQKSTTLNCIKNWLKKMKDLGLIKVRNLGRKGIGIQIVNAMEYLIWLSELKGQYKELSPFNPYEYQGMKQPTQKSATTQQKSATYNITSDTDKSMEAKASALVKITEELEHNPEVLKATRIAIKRNPISEKLSHDARLSLERNVYKELLHKTHIQKIDNLTGLAVWTVRDNIARDAERSFDYGNHHKFNDLKNAKAFT